jgi:hypothetical protein
MKIYVKAAPKENKVIYTGIEFTEFIEYLPHPIENLMLLMGGSGILLVETGLERGLELFEGRELVNKLTKIDVHNLGNFCFIDYADLGNTNHLSEEQIAELLYLGHMFKPLKYPFFEPLQNRFVYLAHDDGWFCKLYCRNLLDFISVLCGKIAKSINIPLPCAINTIQERLLREAADGILIDMEETSYENGGISVKIYTVGVYEDMDKVLNNFQKLKDDAGSISVLYARNNEWTVV